MSEIDIVERLCNLHCDLHAELEEQTGIHTFYADKLWAMASLALDAATVIDKNKRAVNEITTLRTRISEMDAELTASMREIDRLRSDVQEARDWQPMETAPKDRWLLLDMSYVYEGDTDLTEVYVVGCWVESPDGYCWDCGEEVAHRDAALGWMDIPKSRADIRALAEGGE
jgi:hypothetical protein